MLSVSANTPKVVPVYSVHQTRSCTRGCMHPNLGPDHPWPSLHETCAAGGATEAPAHAERPTPPRRAKADTRQELDRQEKPQGLRGRIAGAGPPPEGSKLERSS